MDLKFSDEQIKVLSGIFANVGYIFFASGVLPFLFQQWIPEKLFPLVGALTISLVFWSYSIKLVKDLQ